MIPMNILIPGLLLGIYTMLFFFYLGLNRRKAVMSREMDPEYYKAFANGQEPPRLQILSRHGANLFEMPMLFYVVLLMIYVTGSTSVALFSLAWAFVGLRAVHAFIHLGRNNVQHRFMVFALSVAVLLCLYVGLLVKLLL